MQTLIYFILVPMVYIAFATFLIGTTLRLIKIFREPKHLTTLQIYPEKSPTGCGPFTTLFCFPALDDINPYCGSF